MLADVEDRAPERGGRGVRLRRAREVHRGLRERVARLGQPDVLDRLGGRDRDDQCLRVCVSDVLGREHDHAAREEPRILAALEHRRQVVDPMPERPRRAST